MLETTIRSIDQTKADAAAAARRLEEVINGSTRAFLEAAWKLASILASVGSDPVGYVLNPVTSMKYRREEVGWLLLGDDLWRSDDPDAAKRALAFAETWSVVKCMTRDLRAKCAPVGSLPTPGSVADRRREWIWSNLVKLPDQLTPLPPGFSREPWVHLGAFISFHLGDLSSYSSSVLHEEDSRRLPLFWKGFLRWHADGGGDETTAMLTSVAKSPRVSSGKRKTALLLLWTESSASPQALHRFTLSQKELLRPDIAYTGSGSVLFLPSVLPCKRPTSDVLKELVDVLEKLAQARHDAGLKARRDELLRESFGALARLPTVEDVWSRVSRSTHALIVGACDEERKEVALLLASLTGRPPGEWVDWEPVWVNAHRKELAREVLAWCEGKGRKGKLLAGSGDRLFRAFELQEWKRSVNNAIANLLDKRLGEGGSERWPQSIIATRDCYAFEQPKECWVSKKLVAMPGFLAVKVTPLAERPEDMRAYVLDRAHQGNSTWAEDALDLLVTQAQVTGLSCLFHLAALAEQKAGPALTVTLDIVRSVLDEAGPAPRKKNAAGQSRTGSRAKRPAGKATGRGVGSPAKHKIRRPVKECYGELCSGQKTSSIRVFLRSPGGGRKQELTETPIHITRQQAGILGEGIERVKGSCPTNERESSHEELTVQPYWTDDDLAEACYSKAYRELNRKQKDALRQEVRRLRRLLCFDDVEWLVSKPLAQQTGKKRRLCCLRFRYHK